VGSATALWLRYLRRFPENLPVTRCLIQAHLHARQPHFALSFYAELDPQSLTFEDKHQLEVLSQL
jgi:hypothetical protein